MLNKKLRQICSYIMKHSMVVFPFVVIAAVAVTVAVALGASNPGEDELAKLMVPVEDAAPEQAADTVSAEQERQAYLKERAETELVKSEDPALYSLIASYYNALALGDVETIRGMTNFLKDTEEVRIRELSKYIESYPVIEIYTKPGPQEDSWIAYVYTKVTFYGYEDQVPGFKGFYVCTDDEGNLYMNDGETEEEVLDYIKTASLQDDVVDLNNRVVVEYNELMKNQVQLFDYICELEREVGIAAGEALAAQVSGEDAGGESVTNDGSADGSSNVDGAGQPSDEGSIPATVAMDATGTATTTVNVRASDSEQADKVGKLSAGDQVKVTEQRANGWTKVVFNGKDGFVKSEYLMVTGGEAVNASAANQGADAGTASDAQGQDAGEAIKSAVASTNLNFRKEPNETAEKMGTVVGGDTVEVLSESGGWSQIRYNGLVGYVKSEFLF